MAVATAALAMIALIAKALGQDVNVLAAVWANVLSWIVCTVAPSWLPKLVPKIAQEDTTIQSNNKAVASIRTRCVVIGRPGGIEQLRIIILKPGIATCGYNVSEQDLPFTKPLVHDDDIPVDCVLIRNHAFSVNYADCCIRWGLYESAKQFVGYPIVPGFDVSGVVEKVGANVKDFQVGDRVYGASLFGAYSSRVLIPSIQLRKIPHDLSFEQAASLPAVALTALYALVLAGHFPIPSKYVNKGILIHSAAGGVGSMLVQISKLLSLHPIVGVVGQANKIDTAKTLGCDVVIDKSREDLWKVAQATSSSGYSAVMDSNGVSTLEDSYKHLCSTGRLIIFGFHTNLPMGKDMLSPLEWLKMARKMRHMPKFDPMTMGTHNKSIMAFNLSFFAEEREMVTFLFDQVNEWIQSGKLKCPTIVELSMDQIADAHDLIQSGKSIGKIVLKTSNEIK